jgi:hypothetical protein
VQDGELLVKRKRMDSLAVQLGRELIDGGGGGAILAEITHLLLSRTDSRLKQVFSMGDFFYYLGVLCINIWILL